MNNDNDLHYVNELLETSKRGGYPAIYVFWAVAVLAGFTLAEIKPEWVKMYWVITMIFGMAVSSWLGMRSDSRRGQRDATTGFRYFKHFGIMTICIILAMLMNDFTAILLITGLSYCLAGLYLERIMILVGVVAIISYVAVAQGIITSNIMLGLVTSAGLLVAAWASSRETRVSE